MSVETPLKNQIITWLRTCRYWFQHAGNRLLEDEPITDELVTAAYQLFKEDYGLKQIEFERKDVPFSEIGTASQPTTGQCRLLTIKEITNVNALAVGQSIDIVHGLTIIYGGNGTGKSGYVRMLNNAFSSRGDKHILPNVFKPEITGDPCCTFTFKFDDSTHDLKFPDDKDNVAFVQFSVFDSHSVRVHLEQDNRLNFIPHGFEFFDKALHLYESVSEKLNEEIALNRPKNEFGKHFINENTIQAEVINLGAKTDIGKLKVIADYSEADELSLSPPVSG